MDDGNIMNETWSTLSADDVAGELTVAERAMLKNIRGGDDTLADVISRVIDQVRKAYSDGGRGIDTKEGTIPDGEKPRAIAIARWKLLTSFPQLKKFQTQDREKAATAAESYFMEVSKRQIPTAGGSQIVSKQTRRATRDKMEGLI